MVDAGVDKPFETAAIEKVKRSTDWFDITYNVWSIGLRASEANGVEPKIGDTIELFGKGFGFPVRGIRINGQMAYYRTEAEERIYRDRERYGADATEWLARWDRGDGVWSIAMGGFGPGYEQALQMAAAEALRDMLRLGTDVSDKDQTAAFRAEFDKNERVIALGLSGAQYGAAINLAACLLRDGPIEMMNKVDDDRRIQISAYFPTLPPLTRTDQEPAHGETAR